MAALWLRFLTKTNANTTEIPTVLTENPEISKALEELNVTGFTEEELRAYDKFWDGVRVEKSLQHDSFQEGIDVAKIKIISDKTCRRDKYFYKSHKKLAIIK